MDEKHGWENDGRVGWMRSMGGRMTGGVGWMRSMSVRMTGGLEGEREGAQGMTRLARKLSLTHPHLSLPAEGDNALNGHYVISGDTDMRAAPPCALHCALHSAPPAIPPSVWPTVSEHRIGGHWFPSSSSFSSSSLLPMSTLAGAVTAAAVLRHR